MKCSQCGERWQDCEHAAFEDIQRHKMLRIGTIVSVSVIVLGVIVGCIVLPMMGLFG